MFKEIGKIIYRVNTGRIYNPVLKKVKEKNVNGSDFEIHIWFYA